MRRIESTQVPGETRRMLRERLARFLPVNLVARANLNPAVRPPVSDKELVDLYLNLVFVPGDDISRARDLYLQASQAQLTSPTTPSPQVDNSSSIASELSATGASPETPSVPSPDELGSAPAGVHEVREPSSAAHNASDEPDSVSQPAPPTISAQLFAASPSLEGLSPAPTFDELVERGWNSHVVGEILCAA